MNSFNRNLLVLSKNIAFASQSVIDYELNCLNTILKEAETMLSFCIAHDVIDVNKRKIISKSLQVQEAINLRGNKPFVFISCKN
jgi:hypothetical protein